MLRVTVDLVPYGVEAEKKTLYELTISNVGGNEEAGDYKLAFTSVESGKRFHMPLNGFDRDLGAFALAVEAMLLFSTKDV